MRAPRWSILALLAIASTGQAAAVQRTYRLLEARDGAPSLPIFALGQDTAGYLWLATTTGVGRYDGVRFRSWSERAPRDRPSSILTGADGEVLALDQGGALWRVAGAALERVVGADGSALEEVDAAALAPDGALWISRAGSLLVRRSGAWSVHATPAGMRVHLIAPLDSGDALVAANSGVHRLAPDGTATLLYPSPRAVDILPLDDGGCALLLWNVTAASLVEITGGESRVHGEVPGRPIDLMRRGETFWVATDRYLAAFRPGQPPEVMGPRDGLISGGPLLVDREGSLWLGTGAGLMHFPEPDTIVLNDDDGLPSSHTLSLTPTDEGIWLSTWQGSALVDAGPRGIAIEAHGTRSIGRDCVDARGVLWSSRTDWSAGDFAILERRGAGDLEHRLDGFRWIENCAAAFDGGLWIATNVGLLRSPPAGGAPIRVREPPHGGRAEGYASNRRVFEDSSGQVWLARGRSLCHTAARASVVDEAAWACRPIESMRHAKAFLEPSPGVLWMATAGGGLLRGADGAWRTIPASTVLTDADILSVRPSPSGGIWVAAYGMIGRVEDRPDLPEGWALLEEITGWHGVPLGGAQDVLELDDGTLWLSTSRGMVRVPPWARRPPDVPPRVALAEMLVDGSHLAPASALTLPFHRNRLELHFSALSYRDPGSLRYRIRTGGDRAWSDPVGSSFIRFADLSPGPHRVEVAASLDARRWSPAPAVLDLSIGRPWFLQMWFLGLVTLLAAAAVYVVHRARVASVLRLERQRAGIARDLHDELGSGLGSIGILAELASDDRLEEGRRRALSAQIAETVGELGATLDDIVWSLRRANPRLDALADELAARGQRLFPDGKAAFRTDFPGQWPEVALSPGVRRGVQRIAAEAMHNAARHAGARSVVLGLEPRGRRWRLSVRDDGGGLPRGAGEGDDGLGLVGMRERAAEIDAAIAWESPPGGGTLVVLDFDPASRGRKGYGPFPRSWEGARRARRSKMRG